jgi:hypothetical protein
MYSGISLISGAAPDERALREERELSVGRADMVRVTGTIAAIAEAPFKNLLRLTPFFMKNPPLNLARLAG